MHPARHADGPATIPEMALQLAEDRGGGKRRELEAPARIEALDGLEQADEGDLDEVVALLTAIREAAGEEVRERGVLLDELVPQATVARPSVAREALVEALLAPVPMRPGAVGPGPRVLFPGRTPLPRGRFADVHHQRSPRITRVNRMPADPSTISTSSVTASTIT